MLFWSISVFVALSTAEKPYCKVRFHRGLNCPNLNGDWSRNYGDWDLINEFLLTGDDGIIWKSDEMLFRESEGVYLTDTHNLKFSERLEDWTQAISFKGTACNWIEIVDEDVVPWNMNKLSVRRALNAARGYSDNCRIVNGKIETPDECYWACGNSEGCSGKTPNCVNLRSDVHKDVGGLVFYMAGKSGRSSSTVSSSHVGMLVVAVSVGVILMVMTVMILRGRKQSFEEDTYTEISTQEA